MAIEDSNVLYRGRAENSHRV
eukprot:COSAG02_NODE_67313_length_253_cov_0.675325_2_plen_20_part_01